MEDKVDILLTTYNSKIEYLKEQLDSILNQTYKNFKYLKSMNKKTIEYNYIFNNKIWDTQKTSNLY